MNTGKEEVNDNEEIDNGEEQELSMREVMEEAIDEYDDGEKDEVIEKVTAEKEPKAKAEEGEHVEKTPKVQAKEKKGAKNDDPEPNAGAEEGKAPQSWSPKLREQFGKLDPGIQAQINKRETEMNKALNEGAESRKLGESIKNVVEPYKAIMAADGFSDPMQAISGLMNTAAQLRMGTPQQKAERLAQLIQHYDVDVGVLDNVLSGSQTAQSPNQDMQALIKQELAPVQQFMNNFQQNTQNNANQQVSEFEKTAEFIGDVRNDMADLLDLASSRGQKMTLQEAYDKACAINPEINAVLQQRTADEKIKGNQDLLKNKRQAASSINGHRVGQNNGPTDDSIEATLRQAWDDNVRN